VFSSGVSASSEIITGLEPGLSYYVVVKARNLIGLSEYSSAVLIKAAQVPDPPVNLLNDPDTTRSTVIRITWEPPTFDGGSPVLYYRLWYDAG
jgi:hypothetical protein